MQGRRQLVRDFRARVHPPSPTGQAVRLDGSDSVVIGGMAEGYEAAGVRIAPGVTGFRVGGGFVSLDSSVKIAGAAQDDGKATG